MAELGKSVLGIIMVIIIIAVGAIILEEFQQTIVDTQGGNLYATSTNESVNASNGTIVYLTHNNLIGTPIIMNGTAGNYYINNANFSINTTYGTIVFISANSITSTVSHSNRTEVNITYQYIEEELNTAWNVTRDGLGGMGTFGDWIDIIVILIVVGVVIGLIYGVFRYTGGISGY